MPVPDTEVPQLRAPWLMSPDFPPRDPPKPQKFTPEQFAKMLVAGFKAEGVRWITITDLFKAAMEQGPHNG